MIIQGKLDESALPLQVTLRNGFISSVELNSLRFLHPHHIADFLLPPMFDPQINGAKGVSFTQADSNEHYNMVLDEAWGHGVGGFLATCITSKYSDLMQALKALARWRESSREVSYAVPGIHLEGPGISPLDGYRGAHSAAAVRPWTLYEYKQAQQSAKGAIRMVTLAPEVTGNLAVIPAMIADGVVVALGHTAAPSDILKRAIDLGASLFTHWGNGVAHSIDRHENPLWLALGENQLALSLIADGHHLPDPVLRVALLCKVSRKVVLTSDTSPLAGLPIGRYEIWGNWVDVTPEGKLMVAGTHYLAGSSSWLDKCVLRVRSIDGLFENGILKPVDAWRMAGENIRKMLGFSAWTLQPGMVADFLLVNGPTIAKARIYGCISCGVFHPYASTLAVV